MNIQAECEPSAGPSVEETPVPLRPRRYYDELMISCDPTMLARPIRRFAGRCTASAIISILAAGCSRPDPGIPPSIEFTKLPPAGEGSSEITFPIQGRVKGARKGQRVVLFARDGMWWVQPLVEKPFTAIERDSTWKSSTHPGSAYAALLVDADYQPAATLNELPPVAGAIHAIATADETVLEHAPAKKIEFSGYEWVVRQTPGSPAGVPNRYDGANAWVDRDGLLHLRLERQADGWTSAEASLYRSLGYGTYRFVVRDISQLDPTVVFAITSWDGSGPYREMDIEISRWGEAAGKNAQYVLQPYYVPAKVVRFLAPPGRLTYSFDWEPARAAFRTVRGGGDEPGAPVVASHVFTSGVPFPGSEILHLNLYVFGDRRVHLQQTAEVIVEKFEYLP
jgi:hypothetical protein